MFFDEVVTILEAYDTAVLTIIDANGYPLSVRCQPKIHTPQKWLSITVAPTLPLRAGESSLLCHRHDDLLNNLRSVTIRGALEQQGDLWLFEPKRVIPGMGMGGRLDILRETMYKPLRNASRYLKKNQLARPRIPWDYLHTLIDSDEVNTDQQS